MNIAYNLDCMQMLGQYPDGYFDLAVVDPVYGDVPYGGYMSNSGGGIAGCTEYHNAIWEQAKTPPEYFAELFRVSKNQIIWGGNYFVEEIGRSSPGWIVWDKCKPLRLGQCQPGRVLRQRQSPRPHRAAAYCDYP